MRFIPPKYYNFQFIQSMCLAIFRPANKVIPEDFLENGWSCNPHGAGFCYSKDNQLVIKKGFFSLKAFKKAYDKVPIDANALVHFRFATHGAHNKFNCHPFVIKESAGSPDIALIHNGVISGFGNCERGGEVVSDTAHFCIDVVKPILEAIPENLINFQSLRGLKHNNYDLLDLTQKTTFAFCRAITSASQHAKLCLLNKNGDWHIFGEKQGIWQDDIWYSNDYFYKRQRACVYTRNSWEDEIDLAEINIAADREASLSESDKEELQNWLRRGRKRD